MGPLLRCPLKSLFAIYRRNNQLGCPLRGHSPSLAQAESLTNPTRPPGTRIRALAIRIILTSSDGNAPARGLPLTIATSRRPQINAEKKKQLKKRTAVAAAASNYSTNDLYALITRPSFPGDLDDRFIESGATNYMCCNNDFFTVYHLLDRLNPIYPSDSSVVNAYYMGTILIGVKVNLSSSFMSQTSISIYSSSLRSFHRSKMSCYMLLVVTLNEERRTLSRPSRGGNLFSVDGKARKATILYFHALSHPISVVSRKCTETDDEVHGGE